jgi:Cu(I)/Ag(I) efflux system membrane fusion protein
MKRSRGIGQFGRGIAIAVVALGLLFVIPGSRHWITHLVSSGEPQGEAGVYYTCPMHPDIRLPQPGECPICGMTLVKKTEGENAQKGSIAITTQQVQLTGITVEPLKKRSLYKEIDTYGKIDYDETKLGVVSAWVGGRINRLFVDFTGVSVNKGHPLVELYSPDLISTKREYLLALENLEKMEKAGFEQSIRNARELVQSTRQRLLWLGLTERQLDDMAKSGKLDEYVTIYAPQGGTVIERDVNPGQYVKEGDVLFHIADLSRVWLYADIYEDDIPFLYQDRPGDYYECAMHPDVTSKVKGTCPKCGMDLTRTNNSIKVEIQTRAFPGETFQGRISFTDPFLNPQTRTVRVRVNIENPDQRLKPDMFARVKIKLPIGDLLAVPENAVIYSGTRRIVLVDEGEGKFTPKLVKLGRMWMNDINRESTEEKTLAFKREAVRFHEVLAGLNEGDRVVTSGNFLLGSESQLQGALANMLAEQPVSEVVAENASQDGAMEPPAAAATEQPATSVEKDENQAVLFDAYFAIADKLAHDTFEGIPDFAGTIVQNAANESIRNAAEPLRHALEKNDIKAVRKDFKGLSDVMITYVSQHKAHIKTLPYKIYCPMADANWLQKDPKVTNPYYGASMLTCGKVKPWDE